MFLRVCWTRYSLFPKDPLGCTRVTALKTVPCKGTVFRTDCRSKNAVEKRKGVWTTETTTVSECQCLKLQKIERTRSSYGGSAVLLSLHVKQGLTAAVAGSIREAQLTRGAQMKHTRDGRRTLKSHIERPLWKFVMWLKKNHETFWLVKFTYLFYYYYHFYYH